MYVPKDIHARLKFEADFAARGECYSWSRLFRQASYVIRQKEREIERLKGEMKKGES
jgi:hypothetical protein